jgi:hypothetical protein
MLLEIDQLVYIYIDFSQLMLEIFIGIPISRINYLAACQVLEDT